MERFNNILDGSPQSQTNAGSKTVLIAVMGMIGSGKSSFIQAATGIQGIEINQGLQPGTQRVSRYGVKLNSKPVVLLDTPGFDATSLSNATAVSMVQDYINQTYGSDRTLDGILYLHRINAPRFAGSSGEAIRTVRRMCRDENQYHRIAIVTTFWDAITTGTGEQREADLKALPTLLKDLLDHGANMYRMPDSSTGKRDLLQAFMSAKSVLVKPMIKPKSPRVSSPTAPEPDMPNVGGINLNASSGVGQEASLNALARLIQSNEEAFSRREAAFAAREEKLREQESKSLQNENLLKQQFEAKLGEQSKAFKQALSNEKKRANELEVLINDLTEIQLKQNKMQASKDEQIQLLLRKPTGAYIRAQLRIFMHLISKQTDMTEDELAASLHSQRDDKAINLVSNVCDICYSVIYGTYYMCYECPLDGADQHIFLSTGICDSCRDAGKSCSGGHTSSLVKKSTVSGQKCQRARKRSTRLYCISCSWPINGVYTHCCECDNDDFDRCFACTIYSLRDEPGVLCKVKGHQTYTGFCALT